ncbi:MULTISPECIES: CYTH and CHAD domain-containing protein [Micromonospora]|uniref:CHAD domain-containing protein n=1 Tax=Micromonospora yangpuensis TaxID=683228 RepID=A0A1C6UBL9_9ACTN|nr:CYTH and CHAD domain-containing protein [Micromonospora yangpuensis]GGL87041.1 CHAD domain-containing protein [Micromonospora yangpuensis]SCL51259.1 CHAD domain-containing protein [Micromonospora yangpuensis]
MLEEERKYQVPDDFVVPDLSPAVPADGRITAQRPVRLVATYFDTADLRLTRAGVSLRHRRGEREPWTVKLPTGATGVRHEVSRPGRRGSGVPRELAELVTAFTRGADLAPVAVLRTRRRRSAVHDAAGTLLAEIADDRVTVLDPADQPAGAFRELEVERAAGDSELLDRIGALLTGAGADGGDFVPKHRRALDLVVPTHVGTVGGEPDLVAPTGLPADPTAGDVVTEAVRRGVDRLLRHDPLVRLRAPVPGHRTALQQMRVGCRRLRSDLRTFAPLLVPDWADPLRAELSWLAGVLGAARDAEVLRGRLRRTAAADPLSPLDPATVDRLDAVLADRQEAALAAVDAALRSPRYVALTDALVLAARAPRLTPRAAEPAARVLPRLVRRPWRKLTGRKGGAGVSGLDPLGTDEQWHTVRKQAKRARYAVQAVAPAVGGKAGKLAGALADAQRLLGEHQDAAVAADTWTAVVADRPDDPHLALTAGRLAERERVVVRRVRADFPQLWQRAERDRWTRWLR